MSSADYAFAVVQVFNDERANEIIQIVDNKTGVSVTNDVENVLNEIEVRLPRPATDYVWIYRDTMDNWDEIVVDDVGNFVKFAPLPRGRCLTEIQAAAITQFLARHLEARGIGARRFT